MLRAASVVPSLCRTIVGGITGFVAFLMALPLTLRTISVAWVYIWRYGEKEAIWQSKKDYVRQVKRDKPLKETVFEDLRIIDDATWFKAQQVQADNPHNAGRPSVDQDRRSRPRLLNGMLHCGYHDMPLIVGGGNGHSAICKICKEDGEGALFTLLNRRLALTTICRKIGELVRSDEDLVTKAVSACRAASESSQHPNEGRLEEILADCKKLTDHIQAVLASYAGTEEARRENNDKVGELRRRRAGLQAEAARLQAAANKPATIPTVEAVTELLKSFGEILEQAAVSDDQAVAAKARSVIEKITGGKIRIFQAGPRARQQGWLLGKFTVNTVNFVAEHYGLGDGVAGDAIEVEVEFREPPIPEQIADKVKNLWDEGLKYTEIAKRVGYNRNLVADALAFWFTSHGQAPPDGRHCVGRLKRESRLAEKIADQVMEMVSRDTPLVEVAKLLRVGRKHVTAAIRVYHTKRGLAVPDGRVLRKQRSLRLRKSA